MSDDGPDESWFRQTCLVSERRTLVGGLGLEELEEELLVAASRLALVAGRFAAAGALAGLLDRERIRAGARLALQVAVALLCTRPALHKNFSNVSRVSWLS